MFAIIETRTGQVKSHIDTETATEAINVFVRKFAPNYGSYIKSGFYAVEIPPCEHESQRGQVTETEDGRPIVVWWCSQCGEETGVEYR